jgi:hypothetical protein
MVFFTQRAQALFTPELTVVSNQVAFYLTTLTNVEDKAQAKAAAGALKALSKPSASLPKDYDLFVAAALKLGPFALQPPFGQIGSNTFAFFMGTAFGEIGTTAVRVAALNDFVKTKKAASNQVAQAIATLTTAVTNPNVQLALLQGRQVFSRIAKANKLAATGEAHSGLAANELDNTFLHHTSRHDSGIVHLLGGGNAVEDEGTPDEQSATYTYTRTGLNTGTLVLTEGSSVTTVKLKFTSATGGKFTATIISSEGKEKDSGAFTVEEGSPGT